MPVPASKYTIFMNASSQSWLISEAMPGRPNHTMLGPQSDSRWRRRSACPVERRDAAKVGPIADAGGHSDHWLVRETADHWRPVCAPMPATTMMTWARLITSTLSAKAGWPRPHRTAAALRCPATICGHSCFLSHRCLEVPGGHHW